MSTFPDMLKHMGGVPVGHNNFAGWWGNDIWFVDGLDGHDDNNGSSPTKAFKTIEKVVASGGKLGAGDTLYIRPIGKDATNDPQYYTSPAAGYVTPANTAAQGANIIGAGQVVGEGNLHATYIKGSSTATAGGTFDVRSPNIHFENLALHDGSHTKGCIRFWDNSQVTATSFGYGGSVSNCLFRFGIGVYIQGGWYYDIMNCIFYRNTYGVYATSGDNTLRNLKVRDCLFTRGAADAYDDIYINAGGADMKGIVIDNCVFDGYCPTGGGGASFIEVYSAGGTQTGVISNCAFGDDDVGAIGPDAADEIRLTADMAIVNCMDDTGTALTTD